MCFLVVDRPCDDNGDGGEEPAAGGEDSEISPCVVLIPAGYSNDQVARSAEHGLEADECASCAETVGEVGCQ